MAKLVLCAFLAFFLLIPGDCNNENSASAPETQPPNHDQDQVSLEISEESSLNANQDFDINDRIQAEASDLKKKAEKALRAGPLTSTIFRQRTGRSQQRSDVSYIGPDGEEISHSSDSRKNKRFPKPLSYIRGMISNFFHKNEKNTDEEVRESIDMLERSHTLDSRSKDIEENANDAGVNATASGKKKYVCIPKNTTSDSNETAVHIPEPIVKIVNSSELLNILTEGNGTTGNCAVVLFYAPWCPFCAKTAPQYNALARAFPQLDILAIDSVHFSSLNARFGTIAVPNVLLFHNTKAVAKFNHTSRTLEQFVSFIVNTTGFDSSNNSDVLVSDFAGPLSSIPTEEPDYLLWVAWVFVIVFGTWVTARSTMGQRLRNNIMQAWAEHQHMD